MPRLARCVAASAFLLALVASERSSRACTPGLPPTLLFGRGTTLPQNRLYVLALSRRDPAPDVSREDGTAVTAGYGPRGPDDVFVVGENVDPGTKLFVRNYGAQGTSVPPFEITVGPYAEPPSRLGTLEVGSPTADDPFASSRPTATVSLRLAPEAEPTWAATELALEVDGREILKDRSAPILQVNLPISLSAVCDGDVPDPDASRDECGRAASLRWLSPGKHTVTLRAHVAGASPDPAAASAEVELRCPESTGVKPDAGTTTPRSHGCSFAGASRPTSPLLLALSFVIGALLRRRGKRAH